MEATKWLPGAIHAMVVTALQRKISLQMCNKFRLVAAHLQPSWPTDLLLPGAFHSVAVTAPQFKNRLRNVDQIQATRRAFAGILADGSVITWGHPQWGGDCSAVEDELGNVAQIQATEEAFVAILANGSVVFLGASKLWWLLLRSSRSATERAANSSHSLRVCCDLGRGIRG